MRILNCGVCIFIIMIFTLLILPLQSQSLAAIEPELISLEEFKNMVDSRVDMVIVDVRIVFSYDAGHIPGAISMQYPFEIRERHHELPRDKTLVLYCS